MFGGLLFMILGGIVTITSLFQASTASQASAQVERLSPRTVQSLVDTRADQTVLIEGHISPNTPVQFQQFVAYVRETKGKLGWSASEAVTPPLRIDCPDGSIQVVNQDYHLDGQTLAAIWQPATPFANERFRGVIGGSSVVVIGHVVQPGNNIGIIADVIAVGHKAEYLAGQRAAATWDNNLAYGLLLFLLGTGTFLGYRQQLRNAR
jgi:hypothetical protein